MKAFWLQITLRINGIHKISIFSNNPSLNGFSYWLLCAIWISKQMSGAKLNFVFLVRCSVCVRMCICLFYNVNDRLCSTRLYTPSRSFWRHMWLMKLCATEKNDLTNYGMWSIFIKTKIIFSFGANFELNPLVIQFKSECFNRSSLNPKIE